MRNTRTHAQTLPTQYWLI